jgi:hypothetical protein
MSASVQRGNARKVACPVQELGEFLCGEKGSCAASGGEGMLVL